MKKYIYSTHTKTLAVILFIVVMALAVATLLNGMIELDAEETIVFRFEREYVDATYLGRLLHYVESEFFYAFEDAYDIYVEGTNLKDKHLIEKIKFEEASDIIYSQLERAYYDQNVNYYINCGERVYTNCSATSERDLTREQVYYYAVIDDQGNVIEGSSLPISSRRMPELADINAYYESVDISVAMSIKSDYLSEFKVMWERQEAIVYGIIARLIMLALVAILVLVYLLCVCGKNVSGETKLIWLDRVWFEVDLISVVGLCVGIFRLIAYMNERKLFSIEVFCGIVVFLGAVSSALFITFVLSVARNIKARRLSETSVVVVCFKRIFDFVGSYLDK